MSASEPVVVLLVGVGSVPRELVLAAEQILGPLDDVAAVCFEPTRAPDVVYGRIRDQAAAMDRGGGVLIIADLCGSTLANAAYRLSDEREDCEVLCGANLPMLMKLFSVDRRSLDAAELGELLAETGRRGINLCSEQRCGNAAVLRALAQGEES
jgi:mannose PTS system EIIA component